MNHLKFITFLVILYSFFQQETILSQSTIASGPMIAHGEMKEVTIWLQTKKEADCRIEYTSEPNSKKYSTKVEKAIEQNAFTVKCIADKVEPGKKYVYEVFINNKKQNFAYPLTFQTPALWQWRTDPPDLKIALGSCFYVNEEQYDRPGKQYGTNYEIVQSIANQKPDLMLWLGDNTYLREADYGSRTGIINRYTHTRSLKELQPLLASTHHYAIWDDHDYGPNDGDRGYTLKTYTKQAFSMFWGNPQPFDPEGNYTTFQWGDVQVFLLDNRTFRSPNKSKTGKRTILGEKQLQWLMDNLISSTATFKLIAIGGQFINPNAVYENYSTYAEERAEIIKRIGIEGIKGIVFLSGDRHYSELCRLDPFAHKLTYQIYELTCSPLTSGTFSPKSDADKNPFRIPKTDIYEHNFGMIEVHGKGNDRAIKLSLKSTKGIDFWSVDIKATDLGYQAK